MMKNGLTALLVGCLSLPASAQIYELAYTDTNNAAVVKPPSLKWYNPKGTMTVTHIAGLDRKVKLELLQGTTVLNSQTSSLLTVANRITASDGQAFYGTKFTITPPADGAYILRSTIYDVNGTQISTNSYPFNVDTVGPVIAGDFTHSVNGWTYGSIDVFGPDNIGNTINITGIDDAASGLKSAEYVAIDNAGVERTTKLSLNTSVIPASLAIGTSIASSATVAPTDRAQYSIGVRIFDVAGNATLKTRKSLIDRTVPGYSVEVWNSRLNAWQPMASATSYENPIKFRVKIAKADHTAFNGTKFGFPMSYTNTDASNVYIEGTTALPSTPQIYLNLQTLGGAYTNFYYSSLNDVSLGGSAVQGPQGVSSRYGLASEPGVWHNSDYPNLSKPDTVNRYEMTVEPRSYTQTVSVASGSCTIPAGGTSCVLNPSVGASSGRGYSPYPVYIQNPSKTLSSHYSYIYLHWDFNAPVIDSFAIDPVAKVARLRVVDNDRHNSWMLSKWDTQIFNVQATKQGGGVTNLTLSKAVDEDYKTKYREFSLSALPDGIYVFKATATDTYGNDATSTSGSLTIDNTAPAIAFNYNGAAVPSSINKITDLRVILTDTVDSAPVITAMALAGGPINDALQLGFSKQPNGWSPEVPRMFPTLEAGQEYTLTVTAKDAQGNTVTKAQKFGLTPNNLVSLANIKTFAVAQSLKDKTDAPLALVKFKGALTDGQSQSRGNQTGYITLRSDSAFAVIFNGLTVQPGETKDVVIPLDATGQASLPIYPATPGVIGKASFMIDIPQLTVN